MGAGKKSLLIIDDDIGIRDGLSVLMAKYFDVDTASCGQEAMDTLSRKSHEIYLIDLYLGDMSGFDILKKIRRDNSSAITIILTAYGNEDDIALAQNLGADEFISKPIAYNKLYEVINSLLVLGKSSKEIDRVRKNFSNVISSIEKEVNLHLKTVESVANFLADDSKNSTGNLQNISDTLNVAVHEIQKKMKYLNILSMLKNNSYKDFKSETSLKEILTDTMKDFHRKDILKKVIFEDCTFIFYKKTMGYVIMLLLGILLNSKNSVLRLYCQNKKILLGIINLELPEIGLETHPSIEINLLKELMTFLDGSMNIKKEGDYSNLTLNISI